MVCLRRLVQSTCCGSSASLALRPTLLGQGGARPGLPVSYLYGPIVSDLAYNFTGAVMVVAGRPPDVSEGSLRTAANRGRLKAQKGDDEHWRSNRVWVDSYLADRHRRST